MTAPADQGTPSAPAALANLGKRVVGLVLDFLLVLLPLTIASVLLFGSTEASGGSVDFQLTGIPFLLTVVVWFGYFSAFEVTTGQTLGKKKVCTRVVADAGPLWAGSVAARTLLRLVDAQFLYAVASSSPWCATTTSVSATWWERRGWVIDAR